MPDPQQVDYAALARESGGTALDATAAEFGGVPVPAPPPPTPDFHTTTVADPSVMQQLAGRYLAPVVGERTSRAIGQVADVQVGQLKGAGNTVVSLSRLGTRLPGVKALMGRVYGLTPEQIDAQYAALDETLKPTNTAQALGRGAEQIAETLVPGRMVSTAATKGAALLPRGLQTLGRMAVEGAGGAGMAAAQGSSPMAAGAVSAGLTGAGTLVGGAGRLAVKAFQPNNPAVQDAVAFAARRGIPVDAATATDHGLVRAGQAVVDRSLGGSFISGAARDQRTEAMQRVARELAGEAHPTPVVAEQAGAGVRAAVKDRIRGFYDEANKAYSTLRAIAARPENQFLVPKGGKVAEAADALDTAMFATKSTGDLWRDVLVDAKRNGFKGSPTQLRRLFDERQRAASDLLQVMNEGNEGNRFLKFVADQGGIGRAEKDLQGEVDRLWEMTRAPRPGEGSAVASVKSMRRQKGTLGGVDGVLNKNGLSVDQMVERVRNSGQFGDLSDVPDSYLFELLDDAVRMADDSKLGALDALAQTGVRPGVKWWEPATDADEGLEAMALPVDLRPVKDGLRALHAELTELMPVGRQQYEPGLKALQNVMNAGDYMPAARLDKNLSAIKKLARGAEMPETRNPGQATAANVVGVLEDAVQAATAQGGPAATAARDAGRAATRSKADATAVLKAIRKEPVQAFDQAIYRHDAGITHLREVAKLAPEEMPKLGRAFLETLFTQATSEGDFGKADGLFSKWQNLGPETKKLLYPHPELRRDLDAFFLLAKKAAKDPNPSGSWHMAVQGGQWVYLASNPVTGVPLQIGAAGLSKLMHSPKGVRLLTQGLKLPSLDKATAANVLEQLRKLSERAAVTSPAAVPSTPSSTPGAPAR